MTGIGTGTTSCTAPKTDFSCNGVAASTQDKSAALAPSYFMMTAARMGRVTTGLVVLCGHTSGINAGTGTTTGTAAQHHSSSYFQNLHRAVASVEQG